jgi:CRP-like cAMP-binding protein
MTRAHTAVTKRENLLEKYLMNIGEVFPFRSGELLWNQGDRADWTMVVSHGVLKLQRKWPSGTQTILNLCSRGSILGEESIFPSRPRFSSCTAIAQGKGFRIPKYKVAQALNNQSISLALLELSSQRLQNMLQRMEELLDGSVESRLASTLLRLGNQMGISDGKGLFIPVRLTRGELAEFVGCRAETTTRLMTRWKREGIVDTQREGIVINNLTALTELSNRA